MDDIGRYIICDIGIENSLVTLCNIYGPNKDQPPFFVELFRHLENRQDEKVIIGDFNVVLQVELDRYGSNYNNHNSKYVLTELMEEFLLEDPWRVQNPDRMQFSWRKKKPRLQASRIDYSLVSRGLNIENTLYIPAIKTDHMAHFLSIKLEKEKRGPGYWKFNNTLLKDLDFVQGMNQKIDQLVRQNSSVHPGNAWENIKKGIAQYTKDKGRKKAKEKQIAISQLYENIGKLEELPLPLNAENDKILTDSIAELDLLINEQTKSTIFRSRVRWYEEGEKNSRYFYNLER